MHWGLTVPSIAIGPSSWCPSQHTHNLNQSMEIHSSATLYYSIVSSNVAELGSGLFCGHCKAKSDGWISIRFVPDGFMTGSQAVISIPSEVTILKYHWTDWCQTG
jgi:hypothetical protein